MTSKNGFLSMLTANSTSPFAASTKKKTAVPNQSFPVANQSTPTGAKYVAPPTVAQKPNPVYPATSASPAKSSYINTMSASPDSLSSLKSSLEGINTTLTGMRGAQSAPQVAEKPYDPWEGYRGAMDEYIKSLTPSDEVNELQKRYDNVYAATKSGIARQEESAIPMEFITGRQRTIEQRGNEALLPLQQELERRTAMESSRSEGLKARADFEKMLADQYQPTELGGAMVRLNPKTGKYEEVYRPETQREAFELSEGQSRYEYDPTTGSYREIATKGKTYAPSSGSGSYGGASGGGILSPLAQAVQNGTIALDKIPIAQRAAIASELATSGINSKRQQQITSDLKVVQDLLNMDTDKITGAGQNPLNYFGLSNAKGINLYNQLKGILSLENRQLLQGSGAISDFEFRVLSDAATALGRNLPNAEFRNQLTNVKDVLEGKYAYTRAGSGLPTSSSGGSSGGSSGVTPSGIKYTISQ